MRKTKLAITELPMKNKIERLLRLLRLLRKTSIILNDKLALIKIENTLLSKRQCEGNEKICHYWVKMCTVYI